MRGNVPIALGCNPRDCLIDWLIHTGHVKCIGVDKGFGISRYGDVALPEHQITFSNGRVGFKKMAQLRLLLITVTAAWNSTCG